MCGYDCLYLLGGYVQNEWSDTIDILLTKQKKLLILILMIVTGIVDLVGEDDGVVLIDVGLAGMSAYKYSYYNYVKLNRVLVCSTMYTLICHYMIN